MKSTLIKLGIVAAMGLLVFTAACGGDDDDDGGDGTPASQATRASTAAATAPAADPTSAPDDGDSGGGQQQFSEMPPESQNGVNTLCMIAADPVAGLSQAVDIDAVLQAAQAGQYGTEIAEVAGPFSDAYAGTDRAAFDAAVADMKTVCDDIGWTAQ